MRIAVEDWLATQNLSDDARGCFDEAFLCYRVKAYRAALLFSYLGFLAILQRRLLTATVPPGVTAAEWANHQTKLKQEDVWEETVCTAVEKQKGQPYFGLSDDIRREVRYWRDRRNDCAHFKRRTIDAPQVESLWSFIRSRLNLFVVIGSGEDLLTRVVDHYDPTLTAPGRQATPLVAALSELNLPGGYDGFLSDLSLSLTGPDKARVAESAESSFLDACLRHGSAAVQSATRAHILESDERAEVFVVLHPQHAGLFTGDLAWVRKLWATNFKYTKDEDHFPVLASLLRAALIPTDEKTECFGTVLKQGPTSIPSGDDLATLRQHGFMQILEDVACEKMDRFAWSNQCVGLVRLLLADQPISSRLAWTIYDVFNVGANPIELRKALQIFFRDNANKRSEYEASRKGEEGWPVYPAYLQALRPPEQPAVV